MKTKIFLFLSLVSFAFSSNGFANIKACTPEQNLAISQIDEYFGEREQPKLIQQNLIHKKRNYYKYSYVISAMNLGEEQKSEFIFYQSRRGGYEKKPTIILFSGIQGISLLERYIASKIAARGFSVVVTAQKGLKDLKSFENIRPFLADSVFKSLNLMDYISQMSGVDPENISSIGISLGGFRALYLSLLDMRVRSNVLVVSGLSIADVIAYSELPIAEELRKAQMKELDLIHTKTRQNT